MNFKFGNEIWSTTCPFLIFLTFCLASVIILFTYSNADCQKSPNIILILADDMGWNDVGFHGSKFMQTPNIDALAKNGIILNRHYVQPSCTPSRAALLTGKYPIRTGLQGPPIGFTSREALPIEEKILPQHLKKFGYKCHLVGKWHLGYYENKFTPTKRGFDTFFGYYNGWFRYNDSLSYMDNFIGYDARRNECPSKEEFIGKYATDVFTEEAVRIIRRHDPYEPLYLQIAHTAPHALRGDILQVRNQKEVDKKFAYIKDKQRRQIAGAINQLDESVGQIIEALHDSGLLKNSIILFMADNGGATLDPIWKFSNSASNWPLRGMKMSVTEGGVRGTAAIWSSLIPTKCYVSEKYYHISDWLPTFYAAAGGDVTELNHIDGINQWDNLLGKITNKSKSIRNEILVNIDEIANVSAIILNDWKLVQGSQNNKFKYANVYAGSSDREEDNDYKKLDNENNIIDEILKSYSDQKCEKISDDADITKYCSERIKYANDSILECFENECLFNVKHDPCEYKNLAEKHPDIVKNLRKLIKSYYNVLVPQIIKPHDAEANPAFWGGYWSPWVNVDYSSSSLENKYCEFFN